MRHDSVGDAHEADFHAGRSVVFAEMILGVACGVLQLVRRHGAAPHCPEWPDGAIVSICLVQAS